MQVLVLYSIGACLAFVRDRDLFLTLSMTCVEVQRQVVLLCLVCRRRVSPSLDVLQSQEARTTRVSVEVEQREQMWTLFRYCGLARITEGMRAAGESSPDV